MYFVQYHIQLDQKIWNDLKWDDISLYDIIACFDRMMHAGVTK